MVSGWGSLARVPMCCHLPRVLSKPGEPGAFVGSRSVGGTGALTRASYRYLYPANPAPAATTAATASHATRDRVLRRLVRPPRRRPGAAGCRRGRRVGEGRCRPASNWPRRPGRAAGRSACAGAASLAGSAGSAGRRTAGRPCRPAARGPRGERGWAPLPGTEAVPGPGPAGRRCPGRAPARARCPGRGPAGRRPGPDRQAPLQRTGGRCGRYGRAPGHRAGAPTGRRGTRATAEPRVTRKPGIPRERRTLRIPGDVRRRPGRLAARVRARTGASRALMVHNVERSVLLSSGRVDAELSRLALSR